MAAGRKSYSDGIGWMMAAAVLFLAAFLLFDWGPAKWTGFVYPDADRMTRFFKVGEYKSFEECQLASREALNAIEGAWEKGDYECGLNCKESPDMPVKVCKETRN